MAGAAAHLHILKIKAYTKKGVQPCSKEAHFSADQRFSIFDTPVLINKCIINASRRHDTLLLTAQVIAQDQLWKAESDFQVSNPPLVSGLARLWR